MYSMRKTIYLLRKYCAFSGPISLVPLLGGKNLDFALPFPIFDLVHMQNIWSFGYRWLAVSPNIALSTREQLITWNLLHQSIISLHMHHAYLTILFESVDAVTQLNCFDFGGFCRQLFAHFPPPTLAHFFEVVFFMIWLFLRHINVFNVRQKRRH